MILLIDNYDSFVHNLARYLQRLGCDTKVCRNDEITVAEAILLKPEAILISPGPGRPEEAGISVSLVRELYREIPLLGICLGHQAIAVALGGQVIRSTEPMHGRTSQVYHVQTPMFAELESPFEACRYPSLVVDSESLPDELQVTARVEDGSIMAIEHREYPVIGVQFHPEAALTKHGFRLLSNFLRLAGANSLSEPENLQADEMRESRSIVTPLPTTPVTF